MRLSEALKLISEPAPEGRRFRVALACGFEPLHLATFLKAHLRRRLPDRKIEIETGTFGDLAGSLERIDPSGCDAVLMVLEWPDLDARLGVRQLGVWNASAEVEIVRLAEHALHRCGTALARLASAVRVVVIGPTLALPPFAHTPGWQASAAELGLRNAVSSFALAAQRAGVWIAGPGEIDRRSAMESRWDAKSELLSGFPYHLAHADHLADVAANLIAPPAPKKGLITDLDDTLWCGLVGECGADGVHWDLDNKAQAHGLYQQLLRSLAESGTLIGVASKNDPGPALQALGRSDLLIDSGNLFPVEIGWGRKSEAVRRILSAWNLGAADVVFVDDSPMELAEAQEAFGELECLRFPASDPDAVAALLRRLRDLFGKANVSEEDAIRAEGLRRAWARAPEPDRDDAPAGDAFLAGAEATITFHGPEEASSERAFELLNKTNQFNLNGRRYQQAEWKRFLAQPDTAAVLVSYRDKFGPLGKIALLAGRKRAGYFELEVWVMSCRAFSRRIEHACLRYLFDKLALSEIRFAFETTERNGPTRELLELYLGPSANGACRPLSREHFEAKAPKLFQQLREADHG